MRGSYRYRQIFTMKVWHYLITFVCVCVFSVNGQPSSCTTPNGEKASCKSLFACPILKNAIGTGDLSLQRFIEESAVACKSGPLVVCCGTCGNYTNINTVKVTEKPSKEETSTTPEAKREYALKHLLPSKKYCGMQHADDYFHDYNTTETTVDELPWVMFVSCEDSDGPTASSFNPGQNFAVTSRDCDCSGVLISNRYVLTASNCASAKWVGLGQREQYRNISCTTTPFGDDCSEALPKTPYTEQLFYPNSTLMLLRLKNKVSYSDYVRPICLPLEEDDRIQIEETVAIAKWDISNKLRGFVRTKLNHTVSSVDKCSYNFRQLELQNPSQYMCTTTDDSITVLCKTDSGAPMMYKRNNNWFVAGILRSGYCIEKTAVGNQLSPEVVNWILENMKP